MNCRSLEQFIALYVEGDLGDTQRLRVEKHLETCAVCREVECELRESQSVFKSLRQDVVSQSALASMRTAVLDEVRAIPPRSGWSARIERIFFAGLRWRYALAGLMVGVLIAGAASYLRTPGEVTVETVPVPVVENVAPPPVIEEVVAPAPKPAPKPATPPVVVAEIVDEPEVVEPEAAPPEQIMVKLLTDDPNVIIYWLVDDKGETE